MWSEALRTVSIGQSNVCDFKRWQSSEVRRLLTHQSSHVDAFSRRAAPALPEQGVVAASQVSYPCGHAVEAREVHQAQSILAHDGRQHNNNKIISPNSVIPDNQSDAGLEQYYRLDRPTLFFTKINSFFAGAMTPLGSNTPQNRHTRLDGSNGTGHLPGIPCPPPMRQQLSSTHPPELSKNQSAYFMRLFWDAYHPIIPILELAEFDSLYECLKLSESAESPPITSPVADILIALGMQYAQNAGLMSRTLQSRLEEANSLRPRADPSWPGGGHFRRCREHLLFEAEPTLNTIHCQALIALYLIHGNYLQNAYSTLGAAIRDAFHLDLHRDPGPQLTLEEQSSRKKIWWFLFVLDVRCSFQLDKPTAIPTSSISVSLPDEHGDIAYNSSSHAQDRRMATYSISLIKLAMTVVEIRQKTLSYSSFGPHQGVEDVSTLERGAEAFIDAISTLRSWRDDLPSHLCGHHNTNESFAPTDLAWPPPDSTSMLMGLDVPVWMQRQRILLQLQYHDVHNLSRRAFICFPRALKTSTLKQPHTDEHARRALQHSISIVVLLHSHLSRSDMLLGWSEVSLQQLHFLLGVLVAYSLVARAHSAID